MSKADDAYYRRLGIRQAQRRKRLEKMQRQMPDRLAIVKKIKAGEITLAEGQKIARRLK